MSKRRKNLKAKNMGSGSTAYNTARKGDKAEAMKVAIDTEKRTLTPLSPITLSQLAKLEGTLAAVYGEGWEVISCPVDGVLYPQLFCPNSCAPKPIPGKDWVSSTVTA